MGTSTHWWGLVPIGGVYYPGVGEGLLSMHVCCIIARIGWSLGSVNINRQGCILNRGIVSSSHVRGNYEKHAWQQNAFSSDLSFYTPLVVKPISFQMQRSFLKFYYIFFLQRTMNQCLANTWLFFLSVKQRGCFKNLDSQSALFNLWVPILSQTKRSSG